MSQADITLALEIVLIVMVAIGGIGIFVLLPSKDRLAAIEDIIKEIREATTKPPQP